MCPLRVLLLWALLCPVRGNVPGVQKEIFTRPGSDLLLPIRRHLTLIHTEGRSCDQFEWKYKDLPRDEEISIVSHKGCKVTAYNPIFPNTRTSEDGSLMIHNVALEDGGTYRVYIHNSTKHHIQTDDYTVRVDGKDVQEEIFTRPGFDLLLPIRLHLTLKYGTCDQFEWKYKDRYKEISIVSHKGCKLSTTTPNFPNIKISEDRSLIIHNVTLDNDGIYRVVILNSRGRRMQTVVYTVHVKGNVPGVQEEVFTRPGSDLLLPIRLHLTLSHTDRWRCDQFDWKYKDPPRHQEAKIVSHRGCKLYTYDKFIPNTRTSEDGSLIIRDVTLDNDGIYRVEICNSEGRHIKTADYTVHAGRDFQEEIFTRPGSDLLLPIRLHLTLSPTEGRSCDQFEWKYKDLPRDEEISIVSHKGCKVTTTTPIFPNIRISEDGSLIIHNVTLDNDGTYRAVILNSRGRRIQTADYTVHAGRDFQEEIFTRPGSDLLLPIRLHLTLSPTEGRSCDQFEWKYKDLPRDEEISIVSHKGCKVTTTTPIFPNIRIKEDGSLIIHNVTLDNDGTYRVVILNSRGRRIQTDDYTVHAGNVPGVQEEIFTRPGSDLLLPIRRHVTLSHTDGRSCDQFDWKFKDYFQHQETKIVSHRGCKVTTYNNRIFPNTRTSEDGSLIIRDVTLDNDGIYRVEIYNYTGRLIQTDNYTVHVVNVSDVQEEIITRLGSDLLLPVRLHLTLHHKDGTCYQFHWNYKDSSRHDETRIARHKGCRLTTYNIIFTNTRTSENGSLIIRDVTLDNDGIYSVYILNSTGHRIQTVDYTVHVEVPLSDIAVTSSCLPDGSAKADCSVKGSDPRYSWRLDGRSVSEESRVTLPPPVSGTLRCDVTNQINNLSRSINISCTVPVSDPVLDVKCLQNGSSEISCRVEKGTDLSIFLTVIGGSEGYNFTSSEQSVNVTVPPGSPPESWNISCLVKNNISERSTNEIPEPCPGIPSRWGHLLSPGAVCVLYTVLLICMVNDLRKMKNEMNGSERRTRRRRRRRRDRTEMEMEPTYYNDRN